MAGIAAQLEIAQGGTFMFIYISYNHPIRCNDDPTLCSGPKESVLEQKGGIWSSNNTENPFAEHFKILIHYCSSDNFAGAY